jgi:hypothetical protein
MFATTAAFIKLWPTLASMGVPEMSFPFSNKTIFTMLID